MHQHFYAYLLKRIVHRLLIVMAPESVASVLEPVLYEAHLSCRYGFPSFKLDHEESLPVEGQVTSAYGKTGLVSRFFKKQARLADHQAALCPDINDHHLIPPAIKKLLAISCPQRLRAPPRLIPGISCPARGRTAYRPLGAWIHRINKLSSGRRARTRDGTTH